MNGGGVSDRAPGATTSVDQHLGGEQYGASRGARDPHGILGVPIHALSMAEAVALGQRTVETRGRLLFGVVNAGKLVAMRTNRQLDDAVRTADVILADGMSVVWAGALLGRPLPERVAGIDLMLELLSLASRRRWRVYLLGATEDTLEQTKNNIILRFPGVVIAGSQHGYFGENQEAAIARAIEQSRADILFVAMSSPKKELFLARWFEAVNVPVCHGVGGAFDVLAGKVRRAPAFLQHLGLEWAYRLIQEPRRLWRRYLVSNAVFVGLVIRQKLIGRRATHGH